MINRRSFLALLAIGAAASAATFRELFLNSTSELDSPPRPVALGPAKSFAPGITALPKYRVFIVNETTADGQMRLGAVSGVCTHQTCLLTRSDHNYLCPCHGSKFSAAGVVENGPATESLPWYKLSLNENGELLVDRSSIVASDWRLPLRSS